MTSTCHLTVFLTLREPLLSKSISTAGLLVTSTRGLSSEDELETCCVSDISSVVATRTTSTVPLVGGTEDSRPFANKVWAELRPRLLGEPGGETTSVAPQLQPKGHSDMDPSESSHQSARHRKYPRLVSSNIAQRAQLNPSLSQNCQGLRLEPAALVLLQGKEHG